MIASVSPSDADLEETLNTLKYANRAPDQEQADRRAGPTEAKISQLQATIDALTARLAHYEAGGAARARPVAPSAAARAPAAPAADAALLRRCEQLERQHAATAAKLAAVLRGGGGGLPRPAGAARKRWRRAPARAARRRRLR